MPLARLSLADIATVGGKNASLGEMIRALAGAGVRVPGGFATTAAAYREFLAQDGTGRRIAGVIAALDTGNIAALEKAGAQIRAWMAALPLPPALARAIAGAYE